MLNNQIMGRLNMPRITRNTYDYATSPNELGISGVYDFVQRVRPTILAKSIAPRRKSCFNQDRPIQSGNAHSNLASILDVR